MTVFGRRRPPPEVMNRAWYHDFAVLGRPTPQAEGHFVANQRAKESVLFGYVERAIELSGSHPNGLELFCADGFYSHYALLHGAKHMTGVDLGDEQSAGHPVHLQQAEAMARWLGHQRRATICAGGLYHLGDPAALLVRTRDYARHAMVVQTVVSLADTSADYFEAPVPGWTWGSRFSAESLFTTIERSGWTIVDRAVNALTGNPRLEDRGSAYALCVPS